MTTELHPFDYLVADLRHSVDSENPPRPGEPDFEARMDAHTILQQAEVVQHFQSAVEFDASDDAAALNLMRAIALLDRIRARIARGKHSNELEESERDLSTSQPDRSEARDFLQAELSDGERPAQELFSRARSMGITPRTLKRAKSELKIQSSLHRAGKDRAWMWSLPAISSIPSTQNSALPSASTLQP